MNAHAAFERFLEVMLPNGGCAVALAEVYIDESYDDAEPPILCVAGYVFRRMKAREFSKSWGNYLKRKGLPYFHMKECAHQQGVFAGRTDCVEVETELIRLTRKMTEMGFATTIDERAYADLVAPREGMRSAYATALLGVMIQVRKWAEETGFNGQIAYFFEAGHKHQGDANAFMSWMFDSDAIVAKHQYAGHAFVPKATPALHPADLLAWQWRLETKRRREPNRSRATRADFLALVREDRDAYNEWTRTDLARMGRQLEAAEVQRRRIIREALMTGEWPELPS